MASDLPPMSGDYVAKGTRWARPVIAGSRSVDQVKRSEEFRKRHPEVSITWPRGDGAMEFEASWLNVSGNPAEDGTPEKRSHYELRYLLDYLEARFDQ